MNNYSGQRLVGVAGFRGYSGAELVKILKRHPAIQAVLLEHRSEAEAEVTPLGHTPPKTIAASAEAVRREGLSAVLLATPAEVSLELAPEMLSTGIKVIDLSGAFRLGDAENYSRWYGARHTAPALFEQAVYGLPEFYRQEIAGAAFVANPGCYPTAANLALRPLVRAQVIDRSRGVICDAKSGVSGAGRKPSLKTSFCESSENFSAYGIMDHRHVPEVVQNSCLGEREFTFTAHLLPVDARHSRDDLSADAAPGKGRRSAFHLRRRVRERAVRAAVCTGQSAGPARGTGHKLLRHRIRFRSRKPARRNCDGH